MLIHWTARSRKWKNNRGLLLSVYLSIVAVMASYLFVSKVLHHFQCEPAPSNHKDSTMNKIAKDQPGLSLKGEKTYDSLQDGQEMSDGHFKFSRHDLRLQFKDLDPVPRDVFYDNSRTFQCVQSHRQRKDPNVTDDLWCQNRPQYFPEYKSPCFHTEEKGWWYEDIACLPYFHILGADKCGTTDFHARLMEHPQILTNGGNLGKETYYWCWMRYGLFMQTTIYRLKWHHYFEDYFKESSERIVKEFDDTGKQLISGDGTPMDLWDFRGWQRDPQNAGLDEPVVLTPHLMRHVYPDPCFFVLMRDPVDRLYSDYLSLGYNMNLTSSDFARDVIISVDAMRECLQVNSTRKCFFSDDMYHKMPVRLHVGCYSIFLREWLSVFHRRNFFFLRTEDWHQNTTRVLEKAFKFLDVAPLRKAQLIKIASTKINNVTTQKKKAGRMQPETRRLLTEFYAPFNEDLAKLLDDDHFLWKKGRTRYKHRARL